MSRQVASRYWKNGTVRIRGSLLEAVTSGVLDGRVTLPEERLDQNLQELADCRHQVVSSRLLRCARMERIHGPGSKRMARQENAVAAVLEYHQRTKHHLHRMASSPGYLDWANQPDPFRTFEAAERVRLPLLADRLGTRYADLYGPGTVPPAPFDADSVAMLFELALGLSAWKEYGGNRWALRVNPSSGNLHPTEGYAILPSVAGVRAPALAGGVYHYVSRDHCLERRMVLDRKTRDGIAGALPPETLLVGLSSIHWREAWKYGERAFRYCQHDAGHAIAALRYAAAALGWSARLLCDVSDADVAAVLGLDDEGSFATVAREDREHPDALILIGAIATDEVSIGALRKALDTGSWAGRANALSPEHVDWPAITAAAEATSRETAAAAQADTAPAPDFPLWQVRRPDERSQATAAGLFRQRRSCLALDGVTSIPARSFYAVLDRVLPRPGVPPWDVWPWRPHLHCGIFVHRVRDLPAGLYVLERDPAIHERLRNALGPDFAWERPEGCPEHLPLFRLVCGDLRQHAKTVSCHQAIAADGAFSLGMIAEFGNSIRQRGAWWYRRLFWESGLLGHVLYLEAEAAGIRSTGIGCYFDDAFHQLLDIRGDDFQSLYHFTVGGHLEDSRLITRPAYAHLER